MKPKEIPNMFAKYNYITLVTIFLSAKIYKTAMNFVLPKNKFTL
jgi:hypothetical protein